LRRRLWQSLLVLLGVSVVVFLILHLTGDPAALLLPPDATAEDIAKFRTAMGFDDPVAVQYVRFLKGAVRGDFGESLRHGDPAITLGLFTPARITRLTRSGMLEVLGQDYIRTARAKGVGEPPVVWKHALKNASIPIVTIVGIELGTLLGGSVITETIFAWPGVGRLSVQAIYNRDYRVVQAAVFLLSTTFVLVNLVVDMLYTYLDPRIRLR